MPKPVRKTLLSYLDDYFRRGDDKVFVQRRGLRLVSYSYRELALLARKTARELERLGVSQADRVMVCGTNSAEWVAAFWGCLLRGAVVVPLDEQSTPEFVSAVRKQTDAKIIFADADVSGLKQLTIPVIRLDGLEESTRSNSPDSYQSPDIASDSLAEIIFTSGTTSTPKGVMLTHGNILANLLPLEKEIAKYAKWKRLVHPLRFLVLVPMSHVFGQFMSLFVPQLLGGEVHFENTLNPADVARRTRKSRISVLVLVPRMMRSLREWVERSFATNEELNFKERFETAATEGYLRRWWTFRRIHREFGWKFWALLCGGATLDHETEEFWRRLGFAVLQGYGMTETASLVTVTHPFKRRQGSIGKALPGYEIKLDDAGEISVRGPAVSPGYWLQDSETQHSSDGWLHTGDLGAIDEQGHIYFKGREKDVIVTAAGVNIYPQDLEEVLNRQPEVRAACVVPWPAEKGDDPLAVLIMRSARADAEATIENANADLAEHQKIRRWFVWPEPDFPRTPTEKVLKREVLARIKTQNNGGRSDSFAVDTQSSFVLSAASRIAGEAYSGPVDPLLKLATDLKLDSLGRIELLSALEERYEVDLDEAAFTAATTIGDVEKMVRGEAEQRSAPYPFPQWPQRLPVRMLRFLLFYTIILPITRVMSRMRTKGREELKELSGPVLFVANHVTLGDHAMVLAALPFRLRHKLSIAMEGERLRDWLRPPPEISWWMRLRLLAQYFLVRTFFNVFPLPRHSGFRRSFGYAAECVDNGESILVFPEGRRAPRGQMHMSEFKAGIGVLAKDLNIPVVPVKLKGLYELKKKLQYFAEPGRVSVVFGKSWIANPEMSAEKITEELHHRVEEL